MFPTRIPIPAVLAVIAMTAVITLEPALARDGGGHGGGHVGGGGFGGQGGMHSFGGGARSGSLRLHGGGDGRGFGGFGYGGGRGRGSGFGQNGDGLSDYAPYGRPVTGCDLTTPSRAHPGC